MTKSFESVSDDFEPKVLKFVKVDKDEHEEAVRKFNVQGLPHLAMVIKGKVVGTHCGALSKDALRRFIDAHLKDT